MPAVTIRNLSDETHRALKARAVRHGRSTEAEIRHILDATVRPQSGHGLGSKLAAIGRKAGLRDDDLVVERDGTPAEPLRFE